MSSNNITLDDASLDNFVHTLQHMDASLSRVVTAAAGRGATVVRRDIRAAIPVGRTGNLKRGIKRHRERRRENGRAVYDLYFDPAMNGVFQKAIKHPGVYGGKSDHAYYPASVEYGFLTRAPGGGLRYVPGQHFMRDAAAASAPRAKNEMIGAAMREIEKEWTKND